MASRVTRIAGIAVGNHGVSTVGVVVFIDAGPAALVIHSASRTVKITRAIVIGHTMPIFIINYMVVITIAYGTVIPSIRHIINDAVAIDRRCVINMPRSVNVVRVKDVYGPGTMRKVAVGGIKNV